MLWWITFWFLIDHRPPQSPSVSEWQQRHIFPFEYHPRMSLAPALERLEKPQDRFPEEIFLFLLLPTTPNDRHQSFGWHCRNQEVPFILTHSSFEIIPWLPISCFHGRSACSGTRDCASRAAVFVLDAGCWRPPRIPIYTHIPPPPPPPPGPLPLISETPNSRSQICHLKLYL